MASPLQDLTHLLAELASRLSRRAGGGAGFSASTGDSLSASVSSLTSALNSSAATGTRVLDAALALMCFDSQEVDRARVDCLVGTIISVLSASDSCRVVRPDDGGAGAEMLCVGSPVSRGDCRDLVRSCAALVEKLGDRDRHSYDLLYAVVKAALLSPRYQCLFPLPYYREDGGSTSGIGTVPVDLTKNPSYLVLPSDHSIPLRVLLWQLDPSILKYDLSDMLQEATRRPLLCLRKELHGRMAWRVIIICLVRYPPAFLELMSLFHIWFLATGLGSVLEFHTATVSSVLDVLLEPMTWGISMDLGQKFPFRHAYFPSHQGDLLAILTGPISCRIFLDLVSYVDATICLGKSTTCDSWKNLQSQPSKGLVKFKHSPAWWMIINFPVWFNYATALLFHREGSQGYLSEILSKEIMSESKSISLPQKAALYLSWVLCPSNEDDRQMLANNILELSDSWARNNKKKSSYDYHTSAVNHRRKLRIPTVGNNVSVDPVGSLIKEFDDRCLKLCSITGVGQVQDIELSDFPHSRLHFLHSRVLLGVLLVSSSCINEQDCDILLHYTSTGLLMERNEVQRKTEDHVTLASCRNFTETWACNGACLIFGWFDITDGMSTLIFEGGDTYHRFVSQLRTKIGPYLLKCVNILLKALNDADQDRDSVMDLHDRLLNWNNKGQSFDGREAFEDVIRQMKKRFLFS